MRLRKLNRKPLFALLTIVVELFAWMIGTNSTIFAQSSNKSIGIFPSKTFSTPQIKIEEIRVGETVRKIREVQEGDALRTFEENFKEDFDWLSRASFQIENVSGKPIVYLRINVLFPETRASGNLMVYPVTFGRRPGSKLPTTNSLFLLMPKEALDISLASEYAKISNFVGNRHSISSINRIELEISFIVFEDGTAWSVGDFMRQDPNNPDRYIPVEWPPESKP